MTKILYKMIKIIKNYRKDLLYLLTSGIFLCYSIRANGRYVFFLCLKLRPRSKLNYDNLMEVEVVRTKITLACTECKQRNYNMTKDKKTHPDRMETKKYCRFCKRHTLHKETK